MAGEFHEVPAAPLRNRLTSFDPTASGPPSYMPRVARVPKRTAAHCTFTSFMKVTTEREQKAKKGRFFAFLAEKLSKTQNNGQKLLAMGRGTVLIMTSKLLTSHLFNVPLVGKSLGLLTEYGIQQRPQRGEPYIAPRSCGP